MGLAALQFVTGDATQPPGDGTRIIVHICNDIGGWGRGFVMALSRRWPEPEAAYRTWHAGRRADAPTFALGEVLFVPVEPGIVVANLIGQHHIRSQSGQKPIRYDAVRSGLQKVADHAQTLDDPAGVSVHMPRIGCGLAGGKWQEIEPIIRETLLRAGLPVTVYDLEPMTDAECLKALQVIPGIGPSLAQDLLSLGFRQVADLRHAKPQQMFDRLCTLTKSSQDPCVLYTFRCAVYYAGHDQHDPELLKWWNWKDRPDPE